MTTPKHVSGTIKALKEALTAALEWIDAVPADTLLPTMPGFDRDAVDELLAAIQPDPEPQPVAIAPGSNNHWRKKPVVIIAHQLGTDGWPDEIWQGVVDNKIILHMDQNPPHAVIHTLEGDHRADLGDIIIRGVAGEFYPCKPDIFAATYERADAEPQPATPSSAGMVSVEAAARVLLDNTQQVWAAFGPAGITRADRIDAALRALAGERG